MTSAMLKGFPDPVHDAQSVFRATLTALSNPGRQVPLDSSIDSPPRFYANTAAIALTLFDCDTPVWLQNNDEDTVEYLGFHCGCPITGMTGEAAFAVITDAKETPSLAVFNPGSDEYPDRSTTVLIQVGDFAGRVSRQITGPGIEHARFIAIPDLSPTFWRSVESNHALYPRGVDILFISERYVVGLPRSTRVVA